MAPEGDVVWRLDLNVTVADGSESVDHLIDVWLIVLQCCH